MVLHRWNLHFRVCHSLVLRSHFVDEGRLRLVVFVRKVLLRDHRLIGRKLRLVHNVKSVQRHLIDTQRRGCLGEEIGIAWAADRVEELPSELVWILLLFSRQTFAARSVLTVLRRSLNRKILLELRILLYRRVGQVVCLALLCGFRLCRCICLQLMRRVQSLVGVKLELFSLVELRVGELLPI